MRTEINVGLMTFKRLAEYLGVGFKRVYDWDYSKSLPTVIRNVNGHDVKMVTGEFAKQLKFDLNRSCTPKRFAALTGLKARSSTYERLVACGFIETIEPFGPKGYRGQRRALLSSVSQGKKYAKASRAERREMIKAAWLAKKRANAKQRKPATKVVAKPQVSKTKLIGLLDACDILGKTLPEVYQLLVVKKRLRGKRVGGIWHAYEYSVLDYKESQKRALKKAS